MCYTNIIMMYYTPLGDKILSIIQIIRDNIVHTDRRGDAVSYPGD